MDVDYVGHPLLDEIERRKDFDAADRKQQLGLETDKKVLTLMPGSRKQEIKTMLPIMLKAAGEIKDHQLALAMAPSQEEGFYRSISKLDDLHLIKAKTYDLLEVSDLAMVTSGTATLETALFKVPQVVCYKGNWLSYHIARRLVKVKYISLVNLIADRELVVELIQGALKPKTLVKELNSLIQHGADLMRDYDELRNTLGGGGASDRAAELIVKDLGL